MSIRVAKAAWVTVVMVAAMLVSTDARAQLNTQHIKGTTGLKSGSQAPPHRYFIGPLIYVYNTDTVKNQHGDKLPGDESINMVAYGVGYSQVTTRKIFGAFYGYEILFPVGMNNRLQGTEISADPGAGLTDSVVAPIQLGWHRKRADFLTSYSIFIPTGRYTDGATDNTGLGMWGHEIALGTTVYLTATRKWHAATVATFDFQSKKEDSETRVGNTMNLEGGIGGDFRQGRITAGLVYYISIKLSNDEIENFPNISVIGKNRVFALGPEVSFAIERNRTIYAFLKVNYQWEVYARTATQGSEFTFLASFPLGPIKLPGS